MNNHDNIGARSSPDFNEQHPLAPAADASHSPGRRKSGSPPSQPSPAFPASDEAVARPEVSPGTSSPSTAFSVESNETGDGSARGNGIVTNAAFAATVTSPVPAGFGGDRPLHEIGKAIRPEPVGARSAALGRSETDDKVIARLAALQPLDYSRVRRDEAKALGVSVATLDDRVKETRDKSNERSRLPFVDVEPHPDPVEPDQVLDEVVNILLQFVVMDAEQADAVALWVAHTYLVDVADISPILIVNAPEKACAKTLLQTVIGRMCYRPLPASNASSSALFRAVELWMPTILIDEADTFFRDNPELHGLINAGYSRGGYVLRSEASGDSFEPRMFPVYSAKSIAGIALERHLPDATMSRGVVLNLRRKRPNETVLRLRHADPVMFERVAAKLLRLAEDFSQQVRMTRPGLPDELSDRAQDNWEPLFAIAECAGPDWRRRATAAALMLSSASDAVASTGNELLSDIHEVFESRPGGKVSTTDLITTLVGDGEKPWATYNRGKPISPRQLAKQLAAYGIKSKTVRLGAHSTPKGYEASQFEDAFARYLGGPPMLPQRCNDSLGAEDESEESAAISVQRSDDDF